MASESHDPARDVVALLLACFEEPETAKAAWRDILAPYCAEEGDAGPLVSAFAAIVVGLGQACGLSNRQLREGFETMALQLANETVPIL